MPQNGILGISVSIVVVQVWGKYLTMKHLGPQGHSIVG